MNTHHALQEAVRNFPKEDAPAAALIDFEIEFMNCERHEAELHVELLRAAAHHAQQLAEATHLMASNTRSVRAFKNYIARSALQYLSASQWQIVLVLGEEAPRAHRGPQTDVFDGQWGTITVGAGWVLFEWGLRVQRCRANARARHAHRKL